jgi:hypothetical protein
MPGVARLRSKHSDNVSVLENDGLPPERIIARFGNDGEGWRNMRKRLSEWSLRGRRVPCLVNPSAFSFSAAMRQTSPQLIDCARYQLDMRIVKCPHPQLTQGSTRGPVKAMSQASLIGSYWCGTPNA